MGGERRLAEAGINDGGGSLKTCRGSGDDEITPHKIKLGGPRCPLQGWNLAEEERDGAQ